MASGNGLCARAPAPPPRAARRGTGILCAGTCSSRGEPEDHSKSLLSCVPRVFALWHDGDRTHSSLHSKHTQQTAPHLTTDAHRRTAHPAAPVRLDKPKLPLPISLRRACRPSTGVRVSPPLLRRTLAPALRGLRGLQTTAADDPLPRGPRKDRFPIGPSSPGQYLRPRRICVPKQGRG